MRLFQRLRNLFRGGGDESRKARAPKQQIRHYASRPVVRKEFTFNRPELFRSLRGGDDEDEKKKDKSSAYKATKQEYKSLVRKDAPDPKQAAAQKSKERFEKTVAKTDKALTGFAKKTDERIDKGIKKREAERKELHEKTGHKYDINSGSDKDKELARIRLLSGAAMRDPEAQKHKVKYHPIQASAERGIASGVTFGGVDFGMSRLPKGKDKEAEEYYQKNKSKGAEIAGEVVGSLASFGGTAGLTEKAGAKIGSKLAPKLEGKLVRSAAKRSVNKAVKKGLVNEASEELIKQVGKDKARKIANAVGNDILQNATTGLLYDFNRASTEHEIGSKEWWKEMGKSAAFNAAITGGVAGASALKGNKRAAVEAADELGRLGKAGYAKQAPDARVSLKRRRKTDVVLPTARSMDSQVDDALDDMVGQANTVEDYMALGFGRGDAELLARPIRVNDVVKEEARLNPYDLDATAKGTPIRKGNIKRLAEKLKTDELMPRQRNTQYASAPRSVERVDTSIEGLSKNLDELKTRAPKTDRERRALETKMHDVEDRLNRAKWRKEGGADMDAMRKAYNGEYAGFDMSKSTNSHQSEVLEGKVKGKTATIVEMSPDEYMERAYRQIFKKPSGKADVFGESPEARRKVAEYAEAMKNGEKFPLPYLDFTNAGQEGRHRALAAKAAGIDKIPVVVIDDAANPKAIIEEVEEATAKAIDEQAYAESLNDVIPFESDVPTTPKRGIARTAEDDFPYATEGIESMPSTNPQQTAGNEIRADLENRIDEIAEQKSKDVEDDLIVNEVTGDKPISGKLPSGVGQVRSAYEYNNGEKIEDGILTSWNEAWKASKEYSKSHATGDKNRMSKVAVSQLNAMDSEAERELRQKLVDSGDLNYDAIRTPELYDKIAKQMRDDPDRWVKDMIEINEGGALDFRSTPEWQARVQYIMGTVDPSADQASEIAYTEAFKLAQNISSKGGQVLNLRKNFVHLTPMGRRDAILDDFINILEKSQGFRKANPQLNSLGRFDQRNYIRNILMEDDAIRDGVEKLVNANEIDDVSEAFTELMLNVNKKNPKAGFDVLQELRYLNMLGNPKTHIRNIFGSAFFSPMRQVSNGVRGLLEDSIVNYAKKSTGNTFAIVKHGGISPMAMKEAWVKNPTTEAGQAALEAFNKNKKEILGSAKYETPTYTGRGTTVAGKTLDAVSDFNSKLLAGEDDFFRSRAYRENYIKSYNRYLKDGKPITEKIKRRIEQEALRESQIATFNEYNNFAKWLSNITRNASDANASTLARWGGRGVNAVMPFTKVPANLMKQSINYSPIGIAKGFANIKTAAKRGDSEMLNRAIDELSSGLTGTGIFGLGMLLGKTTDMFTTNAGKNDPAAKFKKDRGMQNYSVTFKDPITKEKHSYTLDWLVPASATFFSGVEMANQMKSGDFNIFDVGGDWSTIMTRLAEPVMETSMLSGLHGMLETMRSGSNDDDTKSAIGILLRETVQSYGNSLVPTLAGQIARTAYKSDMQIAGDTDWEYWRNQLKSKAGLANTNILGEPLGADTDAYGNIKGEKNYVESGLKNFLSPANIQKVDFSEVDNEKLAEYERRVKDGEDPQELAYLFPKKQYKKQFKLAGEDVKMSNRELSTYNQAKTTGGEEGMRYILENIMFNRQTVDSKGKKVPSDSAYTKAEKERLMNEFKGKSMREVEEWLYEQPEFKNATNEERKKAISGLWNLTKDTKAVASQRVGEQAVWQAQGKDVNEYNFKNEVTEKKRNALQPYIDKGILTYEEAVDFARNAGKTYYTENEDGGSATTYYNKKEMIEYLVKKGYSYEKAEALYNSFKNSNAKDYSGNNLSSGRKGSRRYGRRRGGGYRRRGGSSRKAKVPTTKKSDFKASKAQYKDIASSLKTLPKSTASKSPTVKIEPPKVKFKDYEV